MRIIFQLLKVRYKVYMFKLRQKQINYKFKLGQALIREAGKDSTKLFK